MGSRLFANTSGLLGGRNFGDATHRREVATALHLPEQRIPTRKSLAYDQIVQGILDGKIKGLWVIGTNSAHSWIHQSSFHDALKRLDFLVVQDMYSSTETAQHAHLIFPAAGWGEKEGTFINSERRLGVIKKVSCAPGQALADFAIFRLVAHYWGCAGLFREWTSPQAAFQILKRLSAGRPCDFSGVRDYRHLSECGGIQWPWAAGMGKNPARERRLFEDHRFYHPDAKARFIFEAPRALPEATDANHPFILLTGRGSSSQWHTLTRTHKSDILRRLAPKKLYLEMHPQDARALGLRSDSRVRVRSRRGEVCANVVVTATIPRGQVFLPMHDRSVNRLTFPVFDSYSRQPGYKYCAVRVEKEAS